MIRIQSGAIKGKSLPLPGPKRARPTSAKVRSAILNILQKDLPGSVFWDLFAGSGAVGLEAYSRGASQVLFLDRDRELIEGLERWVAREIPLHGSHFSFEVSDVLTFLESPHPLLSPPSILFLDPPYHYANWSALLNTLCKNGILGADFLLVLEYHHKDPLPWGSLPDWGCQILSHHIYGESGVSLLAPSAR